MLCERENFIILLKIKNYSVFEKHKIEKEKVGLFDTIDYINIK